MVTLNVVKDANYYTNLDKEHAVEYYSQKDEIKGIWQGKLAEQEGLIGKEVTKEDMERIQHLSNSERLGLDITYSANKSVSLAYALLKDNRILSAHQKAVQKANEYLEQNLAYTRQGQGGKEKVQASGVAIANFTHFTSRENDPQLHTHSVIMNSVIRSSDGKITALEPKTIFEHQKTLGQIYQNELAKNLQELGYKIQMVDKHGNFEIVGFSKELIDKFSTRRDQVNEKTKEIQEELGLSENKARDIARIESRQSKQYLSQEELERIWNSKLQEIGITREQIKQSVEQEKTNSLHQRMDAKDYIRQAYNIIHENESAFSKEKLFEIALRQSLSDAVKDEKVLTINDIEKAFQELVKEKEIVKLRDSELYTTKEMQRIEKEVIDYVRKTNGKERELVSDRAEIDKAIREYEKQKGFLMTQDQKNAVYHITQSKDKVIGIQGDAGTGKTTSMEAVKPLLEQQGYKVRGLTPTGIASEQVIKVGISSQTIDSFFNGIEKKQIEIAKGKEVWIVDEASMVSSKEMHQLLNMAKEAGARVVVCGDVKQLRAVEQGKIFEDMQKKGMNTLHMTEKVRQKEAEYKELTKAFSEKDFSKTIEKLEQSGKVHEIQNKQERLEAIKQEYLSGDYKKTHIVTATNSSKNELNQAIREELKSQDKISKEGYTFIVKESKNLSAEEKRYSFLYSIGDSVNISRQDLKEMGISSRTNEFTIKGINHKENSLTIINGKHDFKVDLQKHGDKLSVYSQKQIELAKGDKVMTLKNDKKLGINNGEQWLVKDVTKDGKVILQNDNKTKTIDINRQYNYIDHSYATTIHKSQGMTTEKVIFDCSRRTNYNEMYTSLTRGKQEYSIYTNDKQEMYQNMQKVQEKTSTLEFSQSLQAQQTQDIGRSR